MAKRDKNRLYYEVTKERPYNTFQLLMMGGSAGSVLAFFIVSLIGAYEGTDMDSLVLAFLLASFIGFFFGAFVTWTFINRLDNLLSIASLLDGVSTTACPAQPVVSEAISEPTETIDETNSAVGGEENKGKSIDFVFPELSPDKQ